MSTKILNDEDIVISNGKELFRLGDYFAALKLFKSQLNRRKDNGWIHLLVARCYNRLRAPAMAVVHLEAAARQVDDYKILADLAFSYASTGRAQDLCALLARHAGNGRFLRAAETLALSAGDFHRGLAYWRQRIAQTPPSGAPGAEWEHFFRSQGDHLQATLDAWGPGRPCQLSFSGHFTNFLCLLNPGELRRLLEISQHRHIHIQFSSWDLNRKLADISEPDAVYDTLPEWLLLKASREPVTFLFDSCEEAPDLSSGDVATWQCATFGLNGPKHRTVILTANSLLPTQLQAATALEYNIYPLLVTGENVIAPPDVSGPGPAEPPTYDFSMLNGMPRLHRCALMILLEREGLLAGTNYSWWTDSNQKNSRSLGTYIRTMRQSMPDLGVTAAEEKWLTSLKERKIDSVHKQSSTHYLCSTIDFPFMHSARVHIVSETEFIQDGKALRLTEKSIKPLISGTPFVILGVMGIVDLLRKQGFDVLDDIIDHGYDNERNKTKRLIKLVEELKRLRGLEIPADRLASFKNTNLARLPSWYRQKRHDYVSSMLKELADTTA